MEYAEALSASRPPMAKKPKAMLHSMTLSKSDNGGVVAEHRMTGGEWSRKEPKFTFAAGEGAKLAAHIEKHMGMKMGGKAEE